MYCVVPVGCEFAVELEAMDAAAAAAASAITLYKKVDDFMADLSLRIYPIMF